VERRTRKKVIGGTVIKNLKEIVGLQRYFRVPAELMRRMGGYSPFPLLIVIYVTLRCNMKCEMCSQKKEYLAGEAGERNPMSWEEWESLIDNIQKSFLIKPFIHLIGGETLLFPHISKLLGSLKERGFKVSMTTNGLALKQNIPLVLDSNLWHMNISLDGPAEIHDKVRGVPDAFRRIMEAVSLLQQRKREMKLKKPRVCINCVVTPDNLKVLPEVVQIAHDVGVDSMSFQHLIFTAQEFQAHDKIDVPLLLKSMEEIERSQNGIPITFFPRVTEGKLKPYYQDITHNFGDFCVTPWYRFDIFPDGEVRTCRQVFGNVRTGESLKTIWNGKGFRAFRKSLVKQGLHLPWCVRCCHRQYA